MNIFLGILILVMSVFLVVTILLQSSKDHRLSGTIAGGAETFFGKQKGKGIDGLLNKLTTIVCILFFVCVLVMYILQPGNTNTVIDNNPDNIVIEEDANLEGETEVEGEAEAEGETAVEGEAEAENVTEEAVEGEAEAQAEGETEAAAGETTENTEAE